MSVSFNLLDALFFVVMLSDMFHGMVVGLFLDFVRISGINGDQVTPRAFKNLLMDAVFHL
jgi:hypothetical protein